MRLRNQLHLLVLSVLIPAFAASILAVAYVYREEQVAQEKGMIEASRNFSLLVEKELEARQEVLRALANSLALTRGNLQEFHTFAKKMAPHADTAIILADTSGRQLLNTRVPFGAPLPERPHPQIDRLIRKYGGRTPLVSDVFIGPVTKQHDFMVQVPVMRGDVVRYFLAMGANASALQPLLSQQRLPAEWLGVIVDRQGAVLARSRNPQQYVGKTSDEAIRQLFASEAEGIVRSVTFDQVPVKTFFNRVARSNWTVVLSIPEAELRRAPIQAAGFLALLMTTLLGVSLVIAQRIASGVVCRMKRLGASADQLGRGEDVPYQPQGLVEVDSVGARLVDASQQIRRNQLELEQRVALAVADTERAHRALLQSQKMEALGRLTGGIAHEFNNLLQTLTTALQLARLSSDPQRVQALVDTCTKAVKRATALTGQLSAFGRIQDARLETVNVVEPIREFEELVANLLPRTIQLEVTLDEPLWSVTMDPTQFELALINLAINAKDAMPNGGSISVSACNHQLATPPEGLAPGDYVRVCVADTGPGMSREVIARALDPFFTTKKVGEGTGLGLPQAYGFARQCGGTLLLHSSEGEGTTVEMFLPKSQGANGEPREAPCDPQEVRAARGTLLFVEDDPLVRESVVPALESCGFSVLTSDSGDHALSLLEGGAAPDFVLSDIVMPGGVDGIELAAAIRARSPNVKIVLATGYSERRVSIPGVQVLSKPYDIAGAVRAFTA